MGIPYEGTLLEGLTPEQIAGVKYLCETSHLYFSRFFFKAVNRTPFLVGPHHKLLCDTIDRVFRGDITRLIVNVPPRYSKTEIVTIYLIARGFALDPRSRFLHSSFSDKLVNDNSSRIRDVLRSPEFQAMWPTDFKMDSDAKGLWKTGAGGALTVAPARGQITGFGAGRMEPGFTGALIIDDPLKPIDADSAVIREEVNDNYMKTFRSRIALEHVPVVIVMQRVHPQDFTNHLLTGGGGEKFHHLMLPVEIDRTKEYPTHYTHGEVIEHNLPSGPLWPAKMDKDQIDVLRRDGRVFTAQYMQDPRMSESQVFPTSSFNSYEVRPRTLNVAILVDPSGGETAKSDNMAMAVIGIDAHGNKYLLDGFCHRMSLSERWLNLKTLYQRWNRAPGVSYISVGYEKYGMQSDLSYIRERQEIDGPHFPIQELNWPRAGSHSKEARIERLEPDVKGSRFFMPALIWRQEDGGDCYWSGTEHGITYNPSRGPTSAQRMVTDRGEGWRVVKSIKRRDENNQLYDVTQKLIDELKDFPNALHDDLSDAVSRIYDLSIQTVSTSEMNEAAALNEMEKF